MLIKAYYMPDDQQRVSITVCQLFQCSLSFGEQPRLSLNHIRSQWLQMHPPG